jgi:hypothetical protein
MRNILLKDTVQRVLYVCVWFFLELETAEIRADNSWVNRRYNENKDIHTWGNERLPWVRVTTPSFACTLLSAAAHRGVQQVDIPLNRGALTFPDEPADCGSVNRVLCLLSSYRCCYCTEIHEMSM